jgi:hypothetical protein
MSRILDLTYNTMIAELLERTLDAQFDADFDEAGLFRKRDIRGRSYWYYKPSQRGTGVLPDKYVGPADDPAIAKRVSEFASIKDDYQRRRKLVSTLTREARLFRPNKKTGDLMEALWKAGVFRLRACLVGTVAYQSYGAVLGYRLASTAMQTNDIDIAQFQAVSVAVEDSIPPVLEVLRTVDDKFVPAPGLRDEKGITRYTCPEGLRVEFLTPAQGSDDLMGQPVALPALGGAAGEPLRFLDYLLHEPIRTVILHKGGIPVLVPQPQRYAIHKLIVATRRHAGEGKEMKDLLQASSIAAALLETRRQSDLLEALQDAESRGPHWKEALAKARKRLTSLDLDSVEKCLETR